MKDRVTISVFCGDRCQLENYFKIHPINRKPKMLAEKEF